MSQNYTYPPGFATAVNPSIGSTGSAAPSSATEVAGVDSGNILRALSVTSAGVLHVDISSGLANPLPVQDSAAEASLSAINGKLNSLGQKAMAASMPVVIASDQSAIPVADSAAEASLSSIDSKVSTAANQATEIASLASIDGKLNSLGQKVMAASVPVVIASDQSAIPVNSTEIGFSSANAPVRNDYTSTNVTTASYVELVASTTSAAKEIEIFDSSGQTLALAFGGSGSEIDQINIFPGGNGRVKLAVPAATRISVIALSATANQGEIDINFYG